MNKKLADLLTNELQVDAVLFLPELVLCVDIVLLLLIRLMPRYDKLHLGWVALLLAGIGCYLSCCQWLDGCVLNVSAAKFQISSAWA